MLTSDLGVEVIAADLSMEMLGVARQSHGIAAFRCDAFHLPLTAASFAAVLSLRLVFHYPDPGRLLTEIHRILRPGGLWIFDSLNRGSFRHLIERLRSRPPGGGLYFASTEELSGNLEEHGFEVVATAARYLLPTRAYRLLPSPLARAILSAESHLSSHRKVLTFWLARKRT